MFNGSEKDLIEKYKTGEIIIGNYNWIGSNVVILKDAKMINRNVIGAGVIFDEQIESFNLVKVEKNNYSCSKIIIDSSERNKANGQ